MSKRVNFSRHLEVHWLDQVARWSAQGLDKKSLDEHIDRMLEPYVTCKVNRGKTRNQLVNLWFIRPDQIDVAFDQFALSHVSQEEEAPLIVHWGKLVAKNIFFSEVVRFAGRKEKHSDSFTYAQIQKHLVELYGDTETVKRALRSVLKTLVDFQILKRNSNRSYQPRKLNYQVGRKYKSWLLQALMLNKGFSNRSLTDLLDDLVWFPFDFIVPVHDIDATWFELHQQGNTLVLFKK